jgi:bacteriorhodopsin
MKQWIRAVASVFAAFLGVQSEANRRRDFTQGRFSVFVVAGGVFWGVFFFLVWGVTKSGVVGCGGGCGFFFGGGLQKGRWKGMRMQPHKV